MCMHVCVCVDLSIHDDLSLPFQQSQFHQNTDVIMKGLQKSQKSFATQLALDKSVLSFKREQELEPESEYIIPVCN